MATVPFLDKLGALVARRVEKKAAPDPELAVAPPVAAGRRVIVVGYGRVGQLVCEMLKTHDVPYIAVDRDAREIADLRRQGHDVYFGDANNHAFLEQCGVRDAASLVLTLHTEGALDEIAQIARALNPKLTIIARARDADHAKRLYRLGVTDAVPETIEASLQLSEAVLFDLGVPAGKVIASVHERRDVFRRELQEPAWTRRGCATPCAPAIPDPASVPRPCPRSEAEPSSDASSTALRHHRTGGRIRSARPMGIEDRMSVNKSGHIRLTSHPGAGTPSRFALNWGAADPRQRGPVVATVNAGPDRNAIGTHGGSYALYRALAVSAGALNPIQRPDLTNTHPVVNIGPFPQWSEPGRIVSIDPFGHSSARSSAPKSPRASTSAPPSPSPRRG